MLNGPVGDVIRGVAPPPRGDAVWGGSTAAPATPRGSEGSLLKGDGGWVGGKEVGSGNDGQCYGMCACFRVLPLTRTLDA